MLIGFIIVGFLILLWCSSVDVVEYYYKPTCAYCARFAPIWDKAVKMNVGSKMKITDISSSDSTWARKQGMAGIPFIVKYKEVFGFRYQIRKFNDMRTLDNLNNFITY